MNLASPRRIGLGVAGALVSPVRDVAGVGRRVAVAGWQTPIAAPWRALAEAAERRGARDEAWLLSAVEDRILRAIRGPLLELVVRTAIEERVVERVTAEALAGETLERVLAVAGDHRVGVRAADAVLAGDGVELLLAHVVDQPAVDRLIERALASAAFEQHVSTVLDQPGLERVLERALASRFAERATDQLLASDELRRVVAHVSRSEEVRAALHSQTAGFVDDVGDQLRDRTATADDRVEGVARRLLRRKARSAPLASFDIDEGAAPA